MGDGPRDDVRSLGTKELRGAPSIVRGAVKTDGPPWVTDGVDERGSIVRGERTDGVARGADGVVTRGALPPRLMIVGDTLRVFDEAGPRSTLKGAGARTVGAGAMVLGLCDRVTVGARYERGDEDENDLGDDELLTEGADLETLGDRDILGDRDTLGAREKDELPDARGAENEREGAERLNEDPDRCDDDPVDRAPQAVPAATRARTVAAVSHRMR